MAISLAFGVLFAAAITLVVVPSGYLILEDLRGLPARLRGLPLRVRRPARAAAPAPPRGAELARRVAREPSR
jgi:hypothetical protein